jgi:hypothetical protein
VPTSTAAYLISNWARQKYHTMTADDDGRKEGSRDGALDTDGSDEGSEEGRRDGEAEAVGSKLRLGRADGSKDCNKGSGVGSLDGGELSFKAVGS